MEQGMSIKQNQPKSSKHVSKTACHGFGTVSFQISLPEVTKHVCHADIPNVEKEICRKHSEYSYLLLHFVVWQVR